MDNKRLYFNPRAATGSFHPPAKKTSHRGHFERFSHEENDSSCCDCCNNHCFCPCGCGRLVPCPPTPPSPPPHPHPHPRPPQPGPEPTPPPEPRVICDCKRLGIQMSLQETEAQILPDGAPVVFDTLIHQVDGGIAYDGDSGAFTIAEPGDYLVHWQVILGGTEKTRFATFGITVDDVLHSGFPLPVTTGMLSHTALITTTEENSVFKLVNFTGDTVRLSRHLPNANIVIHLL